MSRWIWMLAFAAAAPAAFSMLATSDASSRPGAAEPASGPAIVKGDIDCDFGVDLVDALQVLRSGAGLAPSQVPDCPDIEEKVPMGEAPFSFGDMDCDFDVDAVDALPILLFVAELETGLPSGCTEIGTPIFFVVLPQGPVECWPALISYHILVDGTFVGEGGCSWAAEQAGLADNEWSCDFPEAIATGLTQYGVDCAVQGFSFGAETVGYGCSLDQLHQYADCTGSQGVETGKQPDYDCDRDTSDLFDQVICMPVVAGAGPVYYCYLNEGGIECELANPGGPVFFDCDRNGSFFDCAAP